MRSFLISVFILCFAGLKSQQVFNSDLLSILQEINLKAERSSIFADLYYKSIVATNEYLSQLKKTEQDYIIAFEQQFAPLFFKAVDSASEKKPIPENWIPYFSLPVKNELQLEFIAMNIHINGDMLVAVQNLPIDSTLKYRHTLESFQNRFDQFWDSTYKTALTYNKIRHLHQLSLGLSRVLGKKMVKRWRYRAIRIGVLAHANKSKYNRKIIKQRAILHNWNSRALRWIK